MTLNNESNTDVNLFIDGQWAPGSGGLWLANHNPATLEVIGRVAVASEADLERAANAAARAFKTWSRTPALERSNILRRAAVLFRERADEISRAMTVEQGKPLAESCLEAELAAQIIDWFAEEGRRTYGRIVPGRQPNIQQQVIQVPVGPVASFAPWNFPLTQVARKISAALASGCTIVVKPPEEAPICTSELVRCFADAGVPAGVVNMVFGVPGDISSYLVPHPAIRKISFTGSVPVGKQLASLAGQHMKRVTMELGGHAPVIVTPSAGLQAAAKTIVQAKYANCGQVCISPTRILVADSVYDRFVAEFLDNVRNVTVGDGQLAGTTMGPLNNERRLSAMMRLVDDARENGGEVLAGGNRIDRPGYFFEPTVVAQPSLRSALMNEEPFGPIAILLRYKELDDAMEEANRLPFGLAAYAFSDSANDIARITAGVKTGMLGINHTAISFAETPFGGVKDSGYGSDGGLEAMRGYLQPELVTIATL
ncbi:NAD-dependent succinate-semialdehyde dehydrogenase [Burkholderia gladioli]|uniref:NAD-dependent succinate-semialdehyde dehydrogenase n=1 Tax=Burkholderia gladioli TaxID=28095 RepID=UPI001640CDC2|nr:NAD-dependent succinate-semialdehyde dehydrogenase [Burkholderia gladioli]